MDVAGDGVVGHSDERIGALCPMLSKNFDQDHPGLLVARERLMELVGQMMQRAREAGQLRPDVGSGDLMAAVSQRTVICSCSWTGLRAPARSVLPGSAVIVEDMDERD